MRTAAESALANLGQAIAEGGAEIVIGDLPAICANETAMVRLFQNMIGNAIKYRGKRPPQIYLSAELRGEEYVFSIKDNGIGIDPQYRDKIFEPFRRLHGRSQYEGSGLGLAACQRIIQALNGRIWVESTPGQGSNFFFSIPKHINDHDASAHQKLHSEQLQASNALTNEGAASKALATSHGARL
jgi:chemotaxis family two-component system sensor kinase Cph1